MSYCRWSSDDFQCDLYCYEDVGGGWTTHVAVNRLILPDVLPPPVQPHRDGSEAENQRWAKEWVDRSQAMRPIYDAAKRVPLGLPFDGKSFNDPDLESFLARLLQLREVGYKFPDYVIESVREEIAEERTDAASSESSKEK